MGPHYNLSALWDMHTYYEFAQRDVEATMKTMVAEPYVNHVPTMTGGVGYEDLSRFYKHHFVNSNPADTSSSRSRAPSAPIGSSTKCSSASRMTARSTGCCRG